MSLSTQVVWDRHSGDSDDTIIVALDGIDILPIDTVVKGWVALGVDAPVQLAAAVTDVAAREVTVQLGTAPAGWLPSAAINMSPGWRFTITCDFADGRGPLTWPEQGHAAIRVHGRV